MHSTYSYIMVMIVVTIASYITVFILELLGGNFPPDSPPKLVSDYYTILIVLK